MKNAATLLVAVAALLAGCNPESTTLRDEAELAQENLAQARENAAEIVADSEEEAVDIVADARQEAQQEVRAANEEAANLVQDAKHDLNAVMNELGDAERAIKRQPDIEIDSQKTIIK